MLAPSARGRANRAPLGLKRSSSTTLRRDETPRGVAEFPEVRYVRHDVNRNFAGACNAGVAAAEAPITLLLNNDAYPLGDALAPLVAAFERPDVAIAGGALFFEDGVTQAAGLVVLPNAHWHYSCRNLPANLGGVTASREALAVSGAAMAVRTQWFLDNGGFDESYVNGFEDVDLCLRARETGQADRLCSGGALRTLRRRFGRPLRSRSAERAALLRAMVFDDGYAAAHRARRTWSDRSAQRGGVGPARARRLHRSRRGAAQLRPSTGPRRNCALAALRRSLSQRRNTGMVLRRRYRAGH